MNNKETFKKVIKVNPKTTKAYIQIFNGMFNLTEKEMIVLAAFIDKHKQLTEHGIDVFTSQVKKQIAEQLDMTDFNMLNNYIKAFKDKNAIRYINGKYQFNPLLLKGDEEGVFFSYE